MFRLGSRGFGVEWFGFGGGVSWFGMGWFVLHPGYEAVSRMTLSRGLPVVRAIHVRHLKTREWLSLSLASDRSSTSIGR